MREVIMWKDLQGQATRREAAELAERYQRTRKAAAEDNGRERFQHPVAKPQCLIQTPERQLSRLMCQPWNRPNPIPMKPDSFYKYRRAEGIMTRGDVLDLLRR